MSASKGKKATRNGSEPRDPVTLGQWRKPPHADLIARRGEVWGLLAWYHHEVVLPELGLRGFLKRLWARIRGKKIQLLSPWQQLALRDRWEAEQRERELAEASGGEPAA